MNYEIYGKVAVEKISQYGGDLRIIRKTDEKYNPDTNEYESEGEIINGKGLLSYYDETFMNGSTVQNGDVRFMCIFFNGSPKTSDVIEFGNKKYNVINVNEFNPNGNYVIYYKVQARE